MLPRSPPRSCAGPRSCTSASPAPPSWEGNTESTQRQYALVNRAVEFGFPRAAVVVIDEDLGVSGSGVAERSGFARLAAEVALGHVGLVLGLEVSRLARNNADWYRLLDLCAITDTLIGDGDGLYHPGRSTTAWCLA
jgi:DNA invertase Pin-like site-specific DNA recombinase